MLLIDRYIWKNVIFSWLMVMLVLLGLDFLFAYIDQFDKFKKDYQALEAFIYVLAMLPDSAFELISMATLLACLIGLGQLASSSELIVMRSCGLSIMRILFTVIQPVLLIIVSALVIAQFVSPYTSQFGERYRASKIGGSEFSNFKNGYWQREGNNFIYINQIDEVGLLRGVTVFSFNDDQSLSSFNTFKQAYVSEESKKDKKGWKTQGVTRIERDENKVQLTREKEGVWNSDISLPMLRLLAVGPEKLSVSSLYQYGGYLERQNQNARKYYLEFWNKVFLPLSTVAMVFIAGSFVFGSLRETPMGSRIMVGVIIALVFNQVQTLASHLAIVYQINAVFSALAPALIAFFIGLFMIHRTH